MTLQELKTALDGIENVGHCYGYFPENQKAPYIAYMSVEKNVVHADGRVIYGEEWIELRLVTRHRDISLEMQVEKLLTDRGIAFDYPDYDIDETQRIHTAIYNFMLGTA